MKPHEEKEGEAPLEPTPPHDPNKLTEPNLPAKAVKLTPEGANQADIDAINKRLAQMRKRFKGDVLFIGAKLCKIRNDMKNRGDRNWTRFIERTFPLSVKTANIWIRAYENRDSELAVSDWDTYMRVLYGNQPKQLKAPREEAEERDEDDEQSGGLLLEGSEHAPETDSRRALEETFARVGEPGPYYFRLVVRVLERKFFSSGAHTPQTKLDFIIELIKWLETQKKNIH